MIKNIIITLLLGLLLLLFNYQLDMKLAYPSELWKITFYCNCHKCTGKHPGHKDYGITASGATAGAGMCAVNWLPFGTEVYIEGLGLYQVTDRGAQEYFGDRRNHKQAVDIWVEDHATAKKLGVKYREVKIYGK